MMTRPRYPKGLTLIELMIGVAVGLVLMAAALSAWAHHLRQTRSLMAQTQLNHELHTALTLMRRHVQHTQYWAQAEQAVAQPGHTTVATNPHVFDVTEQTLRLSFSAPPHAADAADAPEQLAYRLHNGVLEMKLGVSAWQALTDPRTLHITALRFVPQNQTQALPQLCAKACESAALEADCPLSQTRQGVHVSLTAQAVGYPQIQQTFQTTMALENFALHGQCPP